MHGTCLQRVYMYIHLAINYLYVRIYIHAHTLYEIIPAVFVHVMERFQNHHFHLAT